MKYSNIATTATRIAIAGTRIITAGTRIATAGTRIITTVRRIATAGARIITAVYLCNRIVLEEIREMGLHYVVNYFH